MSNDDTERRPLVNLRVSEEQKTKWKDYVEESDLYTSLSDLIRKAVTKEINAEKEQTAAGVEEIQSAINPQLEQINQDLEQLKTDVAWLRSQEERDIEELAHELFDSLPPVPADGSDEAAVKMGTQAGLEPQTIQALSERLDTTPWRVEEAIEYLKEQHMPLIKFEVNGEEHWFKEE